MLSSSLGTGLENPLAWSLDRPFGKLAQEDVKTALRQRLIASHRIFEAIAHAGLLPPNDENGDSIRTGST